MRVKTHCCEAWWAGANTCHCPACHETFSGVVTFDKHRSRGRCLDPRQIGLVLLDREYPCWGRRGALPLTPQDSERLLEEV